VGGLTVAAGAGTPPTAAETVLAYPYKAPKKKSRDEHVAVCIVTREVGGETEYLMVQRPDKGTGHTGRDMCGSV
jgi:hypothetical protein